jgi:hypothetical protein
MKINDLLAVNLNENLEAKVTKESSGNLTRWRNKEPANYVKHLQKFFGPPDELTNQRAIWHDKDGFKRIEVLDEFILHASPVPHYDYVYSYIDLKVPHSLSDELSASSESILIDHLKGEVGARCASLSANAVTLQYVMDVVEGNVKPSKVEYETRIKAMKKMFADGERYELDWWPDETKDTDPDNPYYKDPVDENVSNAKKTSSGNSYMLKLERDKRAGMLVLHILDQKTGKRTEVRGKLGYETNGYDPNDKLHQILDKVGKSASVSDLMNGDVVSINPRHPQGPAALKVAHDLANEARSFAPQQTPMQDLVNSYLFFTSFGQMGASDSAKSPDSAEKIKEVTRTLSQSHKNLQNLDKQTLEKNKNKILTHIHDIMNYAIAHFKEHLTPDNFQAKRKQINDILTKYNNLSSTNENIADGKVRYAKPQFDVEWEEAERYPEFVKIGKAAWIELANKGKAATIKSAKGINNTDAADADSFKSLDKDKQARALAQLKSGDVEMPIVAVYPDGWKELIGGNTRLTAMLAQDGKATVWAFEVPSKVAELAENFADGKKPGRKGLAKRMGVNTKASVGDLRKTAKNSSGEKQRMAHWLANMKAGKEK